MELMDEFRARHVSVEIVEFDCLDPAIRVVRVAGAPGLFVFFFRGDVLVGFQDGDGEDNGCGGGSVMVGETVACAPPGCDAGGHSPDCGVKQ